MSIDHLASALNISVVYWDFSSEIIKYRGKYKLFINQQLNERERWQDFGHELGHYLQHAGNQSSMRSLFLKYQEAQADHFAYHFCVPTFMLQELKEVNIYEVMELFNVDYDFAYTRLEMYKNKMLLKKGLV